MCACSVASVLSSPLQPYALSPPGSPPGSSWGFSGQEYWSGLPCPPPGDLPHPGIKPMTLMSLALAGRFFTAEPLEKPQYLGMFVQTKKLTLVCYDKANPRSDVDFPCFPCDAFVFPQDQGQYHTALVVTSPLCPPLTLSFLISRDTDSLEVSWPGIPEECPLWVCLMLFSS